MTPPELPAPGPRHGPWRIPGRQRPTKLAMRSSAEEDRPVGLPSTSSCEIAAAVIPMGGGVAAARGGGIRRPRRPALGVYSPWSVMRSPL